jgi:hypothetical protein
MREIGLLNRRHRVLAWIGLVALSAQAPFAAKLLPDDSWLFSLVVASMLAVLILADDRARRTPAPDRPDLR